MCSIFVDIHTFNGAGSKSADCGPQVNIQLKIAALHPIVSSNYLKTKQVQATLVEFCALQTGQQGCRGYFIQRSRSVSGSANSVVLLARRFYSFTSPWKQVTIFCL
jgi:hypothetical protein